MVSQSDLSDKALANDTKHAQQWAVWFATQSGREISDELVSNVVLYIHTGELRVGFVLQYDDEIVQLTADALRLAHPQMNSAMRERIDSIIKSDPREL
jgi:hypothetical protein